MQPVPPSPAIMRMESADTVLAARTGQALLVAVGGRGRLEAEASRLKALSASDDLLDLQVRTLTVREDGPGGTALGASLRRKLGLDPGASLVWALLGRDGRTLVSGSGLPDPEQLAGTLGERGERNPVAHLRAFLGDHPDHSEARADLVKALKPRLLARLQETQAPSAGDLPPEADDRVWGPVARELDLLFQAEAFAVLDLGGGLLPSGTPERSSPLMKALYRRHRPRLAHFLGRCPANAAGWRSLLRMHGALGGSGLAEVFEGVAWYRLGPGDAALLPYGELAQALHQEARASGAWGPAAAALERIWKRVALLKVALCDKASLAQAPPGSPEEGRLRAGEREELWSRLLEPLLEAKARSGDAGIPSILGELDATWASLGLPQRLQRLAKALGRPELGWVWSRAVEDLPVQVPREGLLGRDLVVFLHGQPIPEGIDAFEAPFTASGMEVGIQEAPGAWARRLSWQGSSPRWALVDGLGTVWAKGTRLGGGREVLAAWSATGQPTGFEALAVFRREHPGHLEALAEEVRLRGNAWSAAVRNPAPGEGAEGGLSAWSAYASALEELLADPFGTLPDVLRRAGITFPERGEGAAMAALAHRVLPRLEADLARRPGDGDLWRVWLGFAALLERFPTGLLENLAPSPMRGLDAWPPEGVLAKAAEDLQSQGRWTELAALLMPCLERRRSAADAQLRGPGGRAGRECRAHWPWDLAGPLLEALVRLGRMREAQEMLGSALGAGDPPGPRERALLDLVAKDMGGQGPSRNRRPRGSLQE